ncbi:MAG TPA: ATP-binding protein [Bacteroidales bacterium]|nr:ATP-binding protein [Bacteroidales bacterium]
MAENWEKHREKIMGFGESSIRKSYYPELQEKISELEVSRENLQTIINNIEDGILIHDIKGNILLLNICGQRLLNIKEDELNSVNILDLSSVKNSSEELICVWNEVLESNNKVIEWNITPLNTDKNILLQVSVSKTTWYDQQAFVAVMRDFSERKRMELELIRAKEKAEESNSLKSAFLQNISHEIRTPMNAIIGFSSILTDRDLSAEKRDSFAAIIINSSNQLLSIVTDVLTISSLETRQEKLHIQEVCINDVITELFSVFKTQSVNQNISIRTRQPLTDKQTVILADKTKVTQILTNLISNALKFTHEGFVEFGYNLKDNMLEFYVKDSGIGIKPELQDVIFERFRQADLSINKNYGGTGLGLSISKGFVELMNGDIWVQSEIGKGSTFYFTIPYKPVNKTDNTIVRVNHTEEVATILVAEDEEYNYLYIEELLKNEKLKLIHTVNGEDTVEVCKTNRNIDLILMDIKMPLMDGYTAAIKIKEFRPGLPIIAQSAYALAHERERYKGDYFDDFITKPFEGNELKQKVMVYINLTDK